MAEYGYAVVVQGPQGGVTEDVRSAAQRILNRNHQVCQSKNDDIPDLSVDWFKTGPVGQAYESDPCPVWHGGSEHPEDCICEGKGYVNERPIAGVFEHTFYWQENSVASG